MSYVDPTKPPELVKNPKTLLDLYANVITESASSVTHVYGLAADKLVSYKTLSFQAASLLHQASQILINDGDTPTTIIVDRTKELIVGKPAWIWATFVRPCLVGCGALFITLTLLPTLADRLVGLKALLGF